MCGYYNTAAFYCQVNKKNKKTSCYTHGDVRRIEFDFTRKESYKGFDIDTALHETGHAVDYGNGGQLYSGRPEFIKAYKADIEAIQKKHPTAKLDQTYNPFPEIQKSHLERIYGDTLRWEGYLTRWGHEFPNYYLKRGGEASARKETWATIFAVCASGDPEKIETAKKVLPNMYACVIRQLKGEIL